MVWACSIVRLIYIPCRPIRSRSPQRGGDFESLFCLEAAAARTFPLLRGRSLTVAASIDKYRMAEMSPVTTSAAGGRRCRTSQQGSAIARDKGLRPAPSNANVGNSRLRDKLAGGCRMVSWAAKPAQLVRPVDKAILCPPVKSFFVAESQPREVISVLREVMCT